MTQDTRFDILYATRLQYIIFLEGDDMNSNNSFGEYVKARREGLGISLRSLAADIGIAPAYLSDIEKGNRPAPSKHLDKFISSLKIPAEELSHFYDLVGDDRKSISPDISDYVYNNEIARVALRKARDNNISPAQWQKFIDSIDTSRS